MIGNIIICLKFLSRGGFPCWTTFKGAIHLLTSLKFTQNIPKPTERLTGRPKAEQEVFHTNTTTLEVNHHSNTWWGNPPKDLFKGETIRPKNPQKPNMSVWPKTCFMAEDPEANFCEVKNILETTTNTIYTGWWENYTTCLKPPILTSPMDLKKKELYFPY